MLHSCWVLAYLSVTGIFRSLRGSWQSSALPAAEHERQGCSPEHFIFCKWQRRQLRSAVRLNHRMHHARCSEVAYAAKSRFGLLVEDALMFMTEWKRLLSSKKVVQCLAVDEGASTLCKQYCVLGQLVSFTDGWAVQCSEAVDTIRVI